MSTKIFIECVWAGWTADAANGPWKRHEKSSIEIWMWTAGITGLCWLIATMICDRTVDDGANASANIRGATTYFAW